MENNYKSSMHKQAQNAHNKKGNITSMTQDSFTKQFQDFYSYVNPMYGIRAKKKTLYDLRYNIEEIYTIAFLKYTYFLRTIMKGNPQENEKAWPKFSKFIYDFIVNKLKKKKFYDQYCMDIMITVDFFQGNYEDIKIFSNLLSGKYNNEDLLFFLFLRNNIEKELEISFLEKSKDEITIQHKENKEFIFIDLYLNFQQCSKIICQVFGLEDEIIINQIKKRIEPYLVKDPQSSNFNCISTTNFLVYLMEDFHNSRLTFSESKGINSVPFVFNKKNEFFDLSNNSEENTHEGYISMLEFFNNQDGEFEENLKNVLLTYIKEKEILNYFDKIFEGEFNENLEEIIYDIRNSVTKKIFILIEFIFNEDMKSFNVGFSLPPDNKNNDFIELVNYKNILINYKSIIKLPEECIEKFCSKLVTIPQLLSQISKIIETKKQEQ